MVVQCTYKVQHPKVVDCAFSRKSLNGGAPCLCLAPLRRLTDLGVRAVHNVHMYGEHRARCEHCARWALFYVYWLSILSSVWKVYYIALWSVFCTLECSFHYWMCVASADALWGVCCTEECVSLLSVCCTEEGGRTSDQGYFAHTAREITHCLLEPLSLNFKAFKASPSVYILMETRWQ